MHIEEVLRVALEKLGGEQREKIEQITQSYPSVAFGNTLFHFWRLRWWRGRRNFGEEFR